MGADGKIGIFTLMPKWVQEAVLTSKSSQLVRHCACNLYSNLGFKADRIYHECFPSRTTLARELGVSPDTIDKCVKLLVSVGAITKKSRYNEEERRNESNIYVVHQDEDCSRTITATQPPKNGTNQRVNNSYRKRAKRGEGRYEKPVWGYGHNGAKVMTLNPKVQVSDLVQHDWSSLETPVIPAFSISKLDDRREVKEVPSSKTHLGFPVSMDRRSDVGADRIEVGIGSG